MDLLIRKIPISFIAGFISLSLGFSDPFKNLDINFLLDNTVEKKTSKKVTPNKKSKVKNFQDVVNVALNDTLSRTVITSLTTMMVVAILYIWGGEVINLFASALIIGVFVGTYSSIFVASPVMLFFEKKFNER